MVKVQSYTEKDRLRGYASVYSRKVFCNLLKYEDYARMDCLHARYDAGRKKEKTYLSYIKYMYRNMVKDYRCEYVYKNAIINDILQKYALKDTVVFNEFVIRKTIVDLVMFNGHSRAFEIKTEYDSTARLASQLAEYARLFQQCYVVFPEHLSELYIQEVPETVGLIALKYKNGQICLEEIRTAACNQSIDATLLMKCLRTEESKKIITDRFGSLPQVSCFKMYEACESMIAQLPNEELQHCFVRTMKQRKNNTRLLKKVSPEMRQMCLQLGLTAEQINQLNTYLKKPLN